MSMIRIPSRPIFVSRFGLSKNAVPVLQAAALGFCVALAALPASSQTIGKRPIPSPRTVVVPAASKALASDLGQRMHANVRFLSNPSATPDELPPFAGYAYETPASLACVYRIVAHTPGCNPNSTTTNASGGSETIAIVDAYDDPNAAADLAFFSAQFGLPYSDSKFKVVYEGSSAPPVDPTGGWELEESLDIEYAHAMAPHATIYLVEANSNSDDDLFTAVIEASNLVVCGKTTTCPKGSKGKGEVSMSFSSEEFAQEAQLDFVFSTPNVVYFAAAGDESGTGYPCVSPNVVCAGGTSDSRSLETGDLIAQIAWSDAGGGVSQYEPIPSYQASHRSIARQLDGFRGVPDISANSNPTTGVWIWDTFPYDPSGTPEAGWFTVGGTSVATPLLAGIVNSTGSFAPSSAAELTKLYAGSDSFFGAQGLTDVVYGACNFYSASYSQFGWDFCTGLGSPNRLQ
jgi:kumamolisin